MFTIKTNIELPIAHCLSDAYSGLCVGNVYRDKKDDGTNERYGLNEGKVLQVLHGHNYSVTISLSSNELNSEGMVVDFKKMKKIIHNYFDQYDHSMILVEGNPLIDIYKKNFEENGIDFERSRIFVWPENPTAEYMAKYWHSVMVQKFQEQGIKVDKLTIEVEETSHNSVTYTE